MVMSSGAQPSEQRRILVLNGEEYSLAADSSIDGIKRSYSAIRVTQQDVPPEPFAVKLNDQSGGYGYTTFDRNGVYQDASKFAAEAPGMTRTYPEHATLEALPDDGADYRGWGFFFQESVYIGRGRYVRKYAVNDTPGIVWPILEIHDLGEDIAFAGRPAGFDGAYYVPRIDLTGPTLERFHQLTTVGDTVTGVQTLTETGSPNGGTFTVEFDDGTTDTTITALAYNITAANLQAALRTIPGLQLVTVARSGTTTNFVWTITMTAAPTDEASGDVPVLVVDDAGLSGGTMPAIAVVETTPGTGDTWTLGPNGILARGFDVTTTSGGGTISSLARIYANNVSLNADNPMTAGDWGPAYPVGEAGLDIYDISHWDRLLCCLKPDGLWTFDSTSHAQLEPLGLESALDTENGIGSNQGIGYFWYPHRTGLIRWRPGAFHNVGAEQDGFLDSHLTQGAGRHAFVLPYGRLMYAGINEADGAALVEYLPGGDRGPVIPHMLRHFETSMEGMTLASSPRQRTDVHFDTAANDAAAGTVPWTNPANALVNDSAYAFADGIAATSEWLKLTVGAATRIPDGAPVSGVEAYVRRYAAQTGLIESNVGQATATGASGVNVHLAVTLADAPAEDTLLVALVTNQASQTAGFFEDSGWDLRQTLLDATSTECRVFTRLAGSGETTSIDVGTARSTGFPPSQTVWLDAIVAVIAADPADPINIVGTVGSSSFATLSTAPSVTTDEDNCLLLAFYNATSTVSFPTFSTPTGMSEVGQGGSSRSSYAMDIEVLGGAGATGTRDATLSFAAGTEATLIAINTVPLAVRDEAVQLVIAGSITGDDMALSGDWPTVSTTQRYGSATEKWGLSLDSTDINGSGLGLAIRSDLTSGEGRIEYAYIRVFYTVDGVAQQSTYLISIVTDASRETDTPHVWRLPDYGLLTGLDGRISHAADDAYMLSPRIYAPTRATRKTYRVFERWLDADPEVNTPGYQVWAALDGGTEFQLVDDEGDPLTVRETGFHQFYFPPETANGHFVTLRDVVPAITGDEVPVDFQLRDGMLRGDYQPLTDQLIKAVVLLRPNVNLTDNTQTHIPPLAQKAALDALMDPSEPPIPVRDPWGGEWFGKLQSVELQELPSKTVGAQQWAAILTIRREVYPT